MSALRGRIADLSPAELSARLNSDGLALSVPPFTVRVRSPIPVVREGIERMYALHEHFGDDEVFCDFHLSILPRLGWTGLRCELDVDGQRPFTPLARGEAFAFFEWGLNWCVTSHCHHWLTLHAAVLERDGRAVLLPAPPGSGKSTLCAWLMQQGWRLMSDELALIDPASGQLSASPRPVSLKNESIALMRQRLPDAVFGPVAHDTLKGMVAHLRVNESSLRQAALPATPRWIVFPRFERGAALRAVPRPKPQTLVELASNSFNHHVHGPRGFECLADLVDGCEAFDLSYSQLDDATTWFDSLTRSS
ncbi:MULTISPECIES: HprK-related kinase A [Hydrogenophaga]|uniref:HPr kinase n=1 Tax=Hydrogenophaga intermedia TaxID=65786 RepID=A0A1L1PGH5_HYDIT|nr:MULTISPECIES: HprK-related kinase A [Hydrogenophaga]CDN87093.1 HPr kinase [Hydrogenophaga intermedia]